MTVKIRIATPWRERLAGAALVAALIAAPAAFAQSANSSGGHEYTVTMSSMAFGATPSGLKVGDTIAWTNNDTVVHSVTARDHSFDLRINPGQTAKLTLSKSGRIAFACLFHPDMKGVLTVAPN